MKSKAGIRRLTTQLVLSILLFIFLPSAIAMTALVYKIRSDFKEQAVSNALGQIEIKSVSTVNTLNRSIASLRLLRSGIEKQLNAAPKLALRMSMGNPTVAWADNQLYTKVYQLLRRELIRHAGVTEARIINSAGHELIRLVLTPSGVKEKAPNELASKVHRSFFKNTMALSGTGVYLHPVTLQKEHKKIVRPFMPVLRVSTKLAMADNVDFGMVVINIRPEFIFGLQLYEADSGFLIADEKGNYLVHWDKSLLWGAERGLSANFFTDESEMKEATALRDEFLNKDGAIQYDSQHDEYHAWKKIHYDETDRSRYWIFFQHHPLKSIEAPWGQSATIGLAGFILIILSGFGMIVLIIKKTLEPLPHVASAMKRLEDGDLSARADIKSRSEIGEIAHAFNSMADWLENYRRQLQKSLAVSSAMSDTAPNAHMIIKHNGTILSANRATEKIFGYTPDELIGRDIKTLMPRPYNEKGEDYVWDYLEGGADIVVALGTVELNAMRKSGEVFKVSVYLGEAEIVEEGVFVAVIEDITERKRAEAAFLENEAKYHNLFKSASDAIYLIDPVTARILDCNHKAAEMDGYSVEELKEMTVLDLHPEEERHLLPGTFKEVMDKGAVTGISDFHHKRKDEHLLPIEVNATIIDIGGKRLILSVVRDITERKQAEREIAKRIKRLKKLSELSMALAGDPIEVFNKAANMIGELLNVPVVCLAEIRGEALYYLSVYNNGEMMSNAGQCALEITPCATVLRTKEICEFDKVAEMFPEVGFLKANKAYSYCGFPSMDSSGEVVAVTCLLDDKPHPFSEEDKDLLKIIGQRIGMEIERKKHLTERKRAGEELLATKVLLEKTFASLNEAVFIVDPGSRTIISSNPAIERIFGYTEEEVIGRNTEFLHVDKTTYEEFGRTLFPALEADGVFNTEYKMRRKDGTIFLTNHTVTEIKDESGNRTALVSVIRDITERKQAEDAITNIAKGVSAETGEEFFRSLVLYLAKNLDAAYSFVGELVGEKSDSINTLAVCVDGEVKDNFEYTLAGTPCINVVGKVPCVYPENVQQEFPEDHMLVEMGVESYMGTPLFDSKGNALGILVVMDRKSLKNRKTAESMLQIFASRASAELERKRAEETLRVSEEKHRAIFEQASDSIVIIDPETGKITAFNDRTHENLGYTRKEFQKLGIADIEVSESLGELAKHIEKVIKEKSDIFETRHRKKSGEVRDVLVNTKSISIGRKNFIQGVWSDITERKRAEAALRDSEGRLAMAQEIANIGSWEWDIQKNRQMWSDHNYRLFGLEPQELEPTFEDFIKFVHPDDKSILESLGKKVLENKKPGEVEFRILRKDGKERVLLAKAEPYFDKEGNLVKMLGTSLDITERKKAEDALIEAKKIAEDASETKTRFVAKTNHELRGPLTSIISMLKLVLAGKCENPEQEKEFLKNVYNSSIHMRGLIENLLNLSVLDIGKMKLNMNVVPFDQLLELVRQITWMQAKEKGLELTFTCKGTEENRTVYCDPDRLRELVVNLVGNAIKFTEKGSIKVSCLHPAKGKMRQLEIVDTGIGIAPERLKGLFEPFSQIDGAHYGGAGLGLTVAKKFVERMGGAISIYSKGLGHGTKVTISLPQAPAAKKESTPIKKQATKKRK